MTLILHNGFQQEYLQKLGFIPECRATVTTMNKTTHYPAG